MTDTTTRTLVPVTVSASCNDIPPSGLGNGEFFAVKDGASNHTLLVPQTDPRSRGMWNGTTYAREAGLDNPDTYRAWTISDRYITVHETAPESPGGESPEVRVVNDARDLRQGDVFRIGATDTAYVVTGESRDGGRTLPIEWSPGGRDNSLADWRGPSTPSVSVTLVPESEQSEWARNKSREVSPVVTDSPESPEDTVTLTVAELNERLESARREGKETADAVFNEWKDSANRTAIEYADSNSLCSEFDRCMRDIGMMDREEWREHNATEFTVEYTYSTTVMAYDSDEALERAQVEFDGEAWRGDWSVV